MSGIITAILTDEHFLIRDLCDIIDSYHRVSDNDRIMYMLATRESPNVFVYDNGVVEELDEYIDIKYEIADDLWSRMTIAARVESLNSRIFYVSVSLPNLGFAKTEYTLFALLRDMRECRSHYSPGETFRWRDVFCAIAYEYNHIGAKINALWAITPEEQQSISAFEMDQRESYFKNMRDILGIVLRDIIGSSD